MQPKTVPNQLARLPNASTVVATTLPTTQDAPDISNNCISVNGQLPKTYTTRVPQNLPHPHTDIITPIFQSYKLHTIRPTRLRHGPTLQRNRQMYRTNLSVRHSTQ